MRKYVRIILLTVFCERWLLEQGTGTVGLLPVHRIVFRRVQMECGYGGPSAVMLTTVM